MAVAVVGTVMAFAFGGRSLNAVVLPATVAVVAGAAELRLRSGVAVRRGLPPDGFPGETHDVTLTFEADDPFPATVTDRLRGGLDGDSTVKTVVGREPLRYEVRYASRGRHDLGPTLLVEEDLLGLFRQTRTLFESDRVLVYPRVRPLAGVAVERLLGETVRRDHPERGEFDALREYVHGDSLRDVHWKSSAKRDSLVVQQYADGVDADAVSVAAGAAGGFDDAMAEAVASIALSLADEGVPVALWTPDGRVEVADGEPVDLLERLATVGSGSVPEVDADVVVRADRNGTTVEVGDRTLPFERLLGAEP